MLIEVNEVNILASDSGRFCYKPRGRPLYFYDMFLCRKSYIVASNKIKEKCRYVLRQQGALDRNDIGFFRVGDLPNIYGVKT